MFDYDDVMTSRNHYLVFTLQSLLVGATCVYINTLVTVRAPEIFLGIMQTGIIQKNELKKANLLAYILLVLPKDWQKMKKSHFFLCPTLSKRGFDPSPLNMYSY